MLMVSPGGNGGWKRVIHPCGIAHVVVFMRWWMKELHPPYGRRVDNAKLVHQVARCG
jgi:hypothetical protein